MILETIIHLGKDNKLAMEVREKIYSDLSKNFRKDFWQYIITTYQGNYNLSNGNGIKVDLAEELTVFCKYTNYNVDIISKLSNDGYSKVEIRELTNIYVKDDGKIDLDDPHQEA